ncbi:MAG: 50S ribosomal protein L19 [Lentisphaerae bacterium]|nr:MAG: 50S ribosomal protein L19 [Lentisphaerota bacterium]
MHPKIQKLNQTGLRTDLPDFNVGDTIRVYYKLREGNKERVQPFQGIVISKKGSGINENFTVRRIAYGVGMERVFPLHSPSIDKIELIQEGIVRRAKLYYLRDRVGKAARVKRKIFNKNA